MRGKNRVEVLMSLSGLFLPQYLHVKVIPLVSFASDCSFFSASVAMLYPPHAGTCTQELAVFRFLVGLEFATFTLT